MTQFDSVLDQCLLERKRAAQSKAHKVVTPSVKEIEGLLDQFAAAPNAIARQIAADVEILTQTRQRRVAGLGNRQDRAGLGVRLGEAKEIVGQRLWQDHQVGLDVSRRQARRVAGEIARAYPQALAPAGFDTLI